LPGRYLTMFAEDGPAPVTLDLETQGRDVELKLEGLSSQVWLLTKDIPKDVDAIANEARKISTYRDSGKSLPASAPDFGAKQTLKADAGKWIRAKDASWMLFAFREFHPSLGHEPNSKNPDLAGNWILARKGAVISFGEVDFGGTAPSAYQAILGAGKENAGTQVSLWDVTGDGKPDTMLAQWTVPQTGKWFDFKTLEAKALAKATGKRKIVMRVENKDCNIRGWRAK
ncbi:MAG: carbohydrate-binding protein, partial [Victivallales bacterium]|nr:carbohydrate-binding protein [Victivallales bacterium]